MKDPILGAVVDLSVLKKDGTMVDYGKYHNMMGNFAWSSTRESSVGQVIFTTKSAIGTTLLSGTYITSGGILYRSTGDVIFTASSAMTVGDMIEFTSGFRAYVIGKPSLSTLQLSLSSTTISSPEQIIRYKTNTTGFGNTPDSIFNQTITSSLSYSYLSGVKTATLTANSVFPPILSPVTPPYQLNTIAYYFSSTANSCYFDIIPPIDLLEGDSVVFKNFTFSITYNIDTPRPQTTCLIGLSTPCVVQRCLGINQSEVVGRIPDKIWLINETNKIPLLSGMPYLTGTNTTNLPLTCVPTETITAYSYNALTGSNSLSTALYTNNATVTQIIYGLVTVGGTIKQIAFGYNNTSPAKDVIHGIIEYDTPVYIPVDKIITLKASVQAVIEV